MGLAEKFSAKYHYDGIYHLLSRTNNCELLFRSDHNRFYFLKKLNNFLSPYLNVFAYCLMDTHFHAVTQVRRESEIRFWLQHQEARSLIKSEKEYLEFSDINSLIEAQVHRFMTSYSKSYNSYYNRHGHLFSNPYKRILIESEKQLLQTIVYVHANPLKHKVCRDYKSYKWSSYHKILERNSELISIEQVMKWFGSIDEFINIHETLSEKYQY